MDRSDTHSRPMKHLGLLVIPLLVTVLAAAARHPVGIAFYDVDRLYDTLPALFYDDGAFTPSGRLGWDTRRYRRKIARTAEVIDSMHLPLVLLCGVENEAVVQEIVRACTDDYCYVHRTLNRLDGLDCALLYFGDRFIPRRTECGIGHLSVIGELDDSPLGVVVSCDDRFLEEALAGLREEHPGVPLVVMGRTAKVHPARVGLRPALTAAERAGRGTVRYRNGWRMRHNALVDTAFTEARGDVYARRFLFGERSGEPLRTFDNQGYKGGYGASLPLFVYIR